MHLVLASTSPRRSDLLLEADIEFSVLAPESDELQRTNESPSDFVQRAALEKAESALPRIRKKPCLVLAADTIVVVDDACLGKPHDQEDAARMLRMLSGRTHQVMSGVCLISHFAETSDVQTFVETTQVTFQTLCDEQISDYVATGEPMDKAGAYAIQGGAGPLVDHIEGSYSNVVGLPIERVRQAILELLK